VAAMLLLTLRGTPTLYQGDELGIGLVEVRPDRVQDPRELRQPGIGLGRDPARTPMAWDAFPNAGFSAANPWLPLHADWRTRNVAAQVGDPASMLSLHRALLKLRRASAALSIGSLALVEAEEDVLAYERRHGEERVLVALNLGSRERAVPGGEEGRVLLSTLSTGEGDVLRPNEGAVISLSPSGERVPTR
ncbi:MAG: alpha-amylase, partial [Sphingomonas bacterium]|uniref:alpha-amylase family glycosyl hydrolase n=1 Tax=Sphingomonas bacterium TaxID=1895847 RepID=UPI002614A59B